jgi:fibronectin type 3 domain-containing protein
VLTMVSSNTASYTDTTVDDQTHYQYTVEAVDAAGNVSVASNTATATTSIAPLGTPTDLNATIVTAHRIDLTWESSIDRTNIASYVIRRNGAVLATVSSAELRYSDATALPGTTYSYTVEAVDTAGTHSVPSDPAIPSELDDRPPVTLFIPLIR